MKNKIRSISSFVTFVVIVGGVDLRGRGTWLIHRQRPSSMKALGTTYIHKMRLLCLRISGRTSNPGTNVTGASNLGANIGVPRSGANGIGALNPKTSDACRYDVFLISMKPWNSRRAISNK